MSEHQLPDGIDTDVFGVMSEIVDHVETHSTVDTVLHEMVSCVEAETLLLAYEPSSSEADCVTTDYETSVSDIDSYSSVRVTPSNSADDIRLVLEGYDSISRYGERKDQSFLLPLSPIPDEQGGETDGEDDTCIPAEDIENEVGQALFSLVSRIETDLQVTEQVERVVAGMLHSLEQAAAEEAKRSRARTLSRTSVPSRTHKRSQTRQAERKRRNTTTSSFTDSFLQRTAPSHRPSVPKQASAYTWQRISIPSVGSYNTLPVRVRSPTPYAATQPAPRLRKSPLQVLFNRRRNSPSCKRKPMMMMHNLTPPISTGRKTL